MKKLFKSKNEKAVKKYNKVYSKKFSSIGGIVEKDDYIQYANGYLGALTIWKYDTVVEDLWLLDLVKKYKDKDCNIIVKFDCQEYEGNITNEINTSLNENEDSYVQTNKRTEQIDAMSSSANLEMVYKEIVDGNEIIIDGQIRVYVYADSEKKLRKKIKILTEKMENKGYKVSTQLGKALEDYKAISNINVNLTQPFPAKTIARGFPYYSSSFEDKNGSFLGFTPTGGTVSLNSYTIDKVRKSFDSWYFGDKGKGKTTSLVDEITEALLRGHRVFVNDIEGTFLHLAKKYDGKIISFGNSEFSYNFLQILKKSDTSSFNEDFRYHVSKMKSMYFYFLNNNAYVKKMIKASKQVYAQYGYFNEEIERGTLKIPLLEDVVNYIQCEIDRIKNGKKSIFAKSELEDLETIVSELDEFIDPLIYGSIFNVQTNFNVQNEQFVVFDLSSIKRDPDEIASAEMFLINNLMWNEMMKNKTNVDANGNHIFLVLVYDEAKNFVSSSVAMDHLKFIEDVSREDRKYFCRQIFATQSIRDVIYNDGSAKSHVIQAILEQSTYRFFMGMDGNLVPMIRQSYPHIPYSYLQDIPRFKEGDMVLDIKGVTSIRFHHDISKEQLMIYES